MDEYPSFHVKRAILSEKLLAVAYILDPTFYSSNLFPLTLICTRNEGNLRYSAQLRAVQAKVPNLVLRRVHSDSFLLEANMKRLANKFRKSKWLAFHMR